jgi:hypothetical protein
VPVRQYASNNQQQNDKKNTTMNDDNKDTENEMLWAAQDLRTLTSNKAEITISRRVTIKIGAIKPSWDYQITFGDILNRGAWRWECAQSDELEGAMDITRGQITAQGDEKARELQQLQDAAAKLGLKLVEAAA